MRFVYLHLLLYGAWIAVNLGWTPLKPFDPSFVILAMEASVEAIFLSTFVLITQNRMAALADRRADLDLQVSLLTEHEVTRVVTLVTAMAERMGCPRPGPRNSPSWRRTCHPRRCSTGSTWESENRGSRPPGPPRGRETSLPPRGPTTRPDPFQREGPS
jgi:uncharacterized membrane protein